MTMTPDSAKQVAVTATAEDYDALRAIGLSAFKASEVILDCNRGDKYAQTWVAHARTAASTARQDAGGRG